MPPRPGWIGAPRRPSRPRTGSRGSSTSYAEIAPDFAGVDPGAVWEDTKLGLSHFLSWERGAMVADVAWIKQAARFFAFLMPGMLRVFPTAEAWAPAARSPPCWAPISCSIPTRASAHL
ncbi:MAG: STAS/SEC14 domain-containing protein [Mycobacterium sp.]